MKNIATIAFLFAAVAATSSSATSDVRLGPQLAIAAPSSLATTILESPGLTELSEEGFGSIETPTSLCFNSCLGSPSTVRFMNCADGCRSACRRRCNEVYSTCANRCYDNPVSSEAASICRRNCYDQRNEVCYNSCDMERAVATENMFQ